MKPCPVAVQRRDPSHPISIPSIPSPPNSLLMSEKSTASVASSVTSAADLASRYGFGSAAKS